MSTNTQARILNQIELAVAGTVTDKGTLGMTLVVDSEYANTGTLGAVRPTDLVAANRMSYGFQDGHATFRPVSARGGASHDSVYVDYQKGPDHAAEQVARVVEYLTRGIRRETEGVRRTA